ncbi:MAG TPA: 3'(2'),5'-bisphosphate nucleotidase [Anaerovoracaceae bacterium]|nr:3'(2'),5'-bisphosphate nucleotidase [Anaerovoracaceae bacterium]
MERELKFAIDVVSKACTLTKAIQLEKSSLVFEKEDRSPVTLADFSSQLLITHYLQEFFPNHSLVAEENILELSKGDKKIIDQLSGLLSQYIPDHSLEKTVAQQERLVRQKNHNRYWVLDPVDGTKGFLRGEQFAIALALIDDGVPILGVIGCPNLNIQSQPENIGQGIIAYGTQGKGAWIQNNDSQGKPVQLSVSKCSDASAAKFVSSVESGHSDNDDILALKAYLHNQEADHQFDSQAKYVMVAAGKLDMFLRRPPKQNPNYREKIWDHAAGTLIVSEGGGMVTDLFGRPFDFTRGTTLTENYGVIVSNGLFHQTIVDYFNR